MNYALCYTFLVHNKTDNMSFGLVLTGIINFVNHSEKMYFLVAWEECLVFTSNIVNLNFIFLPVWQKTNKNHNKIYVCV